MGTINDFMMIDLSKHVYEKIKQQESVLKDYHRYIPNVKQFLEIAKVFLDPVFLRLETDKILQFSNKSCPFLVFSNLLLIFHALVFHKSMMLVKPEDRWWTKNKKDEHFQALVSMIIEISGKIKYEYEPKFSKKKTMSHSKVYSINSHDLHEDQMMKSCHSNDSRNEKNKRESEFFYSNVNSHFVDKINEVDNNLMGIKHARSCEEIAAKYKTYDEIMEDPDDDEINEEDKMNKHKAADCTKYTFNLSPSAKKSLKDKE